VASRKPIIIGNWKMNLSVDDGLALAGAVSRAAAEAPEVEVGIAPPFTALASIARQLPTDGSVALAAQNCHHEPKGAFTGEVAVPMLKEVGCTHVILGHSERRQFFGETDEGVNRKAKAVLAGGLIPVICVGELLEQREAGKTFEVVGAQLRGALEGLTADQVAKSVIAYEPVWAIGTGKVATNEQAQEVHAFLRAQLVEICGSDTAEKTRIQYGGSVKPDNVTGLMAQPDVDGALVGGASLKADTFAGILKYNRSA
jgi:triosephosphate isomerase